MNSYPQIQTGIIPIRRLSTRLLDLLVRINGKETLTVSQLNEELQACGISSGINEESEIGSLTIVNNPPGIWYWIK